MQLLDARLVRHGRERIGCARWGLGGIFAARAVHLVHLLSLSVIRLHVFVSDGPGGRNTVVMLELAKILLAQPVERRAIHLGGPSDKIVETGLERLPHLVVPGFLGNVAVLDEHLFYVPVLLLTLQPVAAFEQEDALARRRQVTRQRAAARPAANDNDVVMCAHGSLPDRNSKPERNKGRG